MQKKSLKQIAYENIKENILSGVFSNGKVYSAQYFADYFNMSRTPIREAVLQLSNENILTILPNKGIIIKELDKVMLHRLSQVRCMVDGYCASVLAENSKTISSLMTISSLKTIIQQQETMMNNADNIDDIRSSWFDLDYKFHSTIIESVGNPYLSESIIDIYYYIKYIGLVTAGIENRIQESIQENKDILNAIISGDSKSAYRNSVLHAKRIFKLMEQHIDMSSN